MEYLVEFEVDVPEGTPDSRSSGGSAPRRGLDWLNKGIFISVGGRQAANVIYETYLVG
ncbi:MAG TPA: hypothetical protein VNB91_06805 [Jatrophihabitantaceae bacterium]|nr:hypothetical protein [Jatrophihabitantaceae bacterium]